MRVFVPRVFALVCCCYSSNHIDGPERNKKAKEALVGGLLLKCISRESVIRLELLTVDVCPYRTEMQSSLWMLKNLWEKWVILHRDAHRKIEAFLFLTFKYTQRCV